MKPKPRQKFHDIACLHFHLYFFILYCFPTKTIGFSYLSLRTVYVMDILELYLFILHTYFFFTAKMLWYAAHQPSDEVPEKKGKKEKKSKSNHNYCCTKWELTSVWLSGNHIPIYLYILTTLHVRNVISRWQKTAASQLHFSNWSSPAGRWIQSVLAVYFNKTLCFCLWC